MAKKAFEIQSSDLVIGGVNLQAGTTGVVIPGVTQATTYKVDEVNETDVEQTYSNFPPESEVVVIDKALYDTIVANGNVSTFADFTATTNDDGEIDEIKVNGRGTYSLANADRAGLNDMYAYIGAGSASDRPLVPEDWIQIPFRPKMRAGQVQNIGGGSGGVVVRSVEFPYGEEGDTRGTIADVGEGVLYYCKQDWAEGETFEVETAELFATGQTGGDVSFVIAQSQYPDITDLVNIDNPGEWTVTADLELAGQGTWTVTTIEVNTLTQGEFQGEQAWWFKVGSLGLNYPTQIEEIPAGTTFELSYSPVIWQQISTTTNPLGDLTVVNGNEITNDNGELVLSVTGGNADLILTTTDGGDDILLTADDEIRLTASEEIRLRTYNSNVTIITNYSGGESDHTWNFDASGNLTLPPGGDILDSIGNSVLGGGVTSPLYVTANVDGKITTSIDGTTWTAPFDTGLTSIGTVAVGPRKIIFTGDDVNGDPGEAGPPFAGLYATSDPTVQPTLIAGTVNNGGPDIYWLQVKYFADATYPWVAVGYIDGTYRYAALAYSANGVNWSFTDINDGGQYATSNFEFTDIAYANNRYVIAARGNSVAGGIWTTTDLTSAITTSNNIGIEDDFRAIEYFGAGGFGYRWMAFTTSEGFWYTDNVDPTVTADWDSWGDGEIAAIIQEETGLSGQTVEEVTAGQDGSGNWVWMTSSSAGHIVWWPNAPAGPFVSIPNPYTATITNITSNTVASISFSGSSQYESGEKIVISGVTPSGFNGTYYYNVGDNGLYTDSGLTTPFDSSALTYVSGGTITWTHGTYIDALGYADGKFYCANDDEEIFEGVFGEGNLIWTKVDDRDNSLVFWNSFAYYNEFISGTSNTLVNGSQTFTLNSDGSITFPDDTVQTTAYTGGVVDGFDVGADGTKRAVVYEQEGIANYSSELINGMPSFLSATPRSPDRKTVGTHWGFDGDGMWFTGDNQDSSDGDPTPAYPVYTTDSFPSNAKAVVTFIFTLTGDGDEDQGICFYPANGVPYWSWDPHPSRIAVMLNGSDPEIHGLNKYVGANFSIDTDTSYIARVTYEPTKPLITLEVIDRNTNKVISTAWLNERLPEGQDYRIGFDADWDEAGPGDKSYFSDLTITVGDDNLSVATEFTLTGKVKLPSSVKGHINLEGPWSNNDDDIEYQAVTTHNGYAYIIGADEWQDNDQLRLYKYSLTTGELVWQKILFAGENASFNISWTGGVYTIDSIANSGVGYIVGEKLFIEGFQFGGGSANGATIELTDVDTGGGGVISATITGTAPAGDNSGLYSPTNSQNQVNPTGISYDAANNQLVVLFSIWGGPGDADDPSWDRAVVLRVSPDTGAEISSITLTDEGDVVPYAIDVGSTGTPVVAGLKYNEYRTFGSLTMAVKGNGYFDILKSNLDPEHYPGSGTPGDEAYNFFIQGTGIATKAVVASSNYYEQVACSIREGSGTVTVDLAEPSAIPFSLQDFTDTTLLDGANVTKNSDNFVTNGSPSGCWLTIATGSLATSITSAYTHGSIIPITWTVGSTTTSGYALVYFNMDGTIQFTASDAGGTPVAGTWYFPANLAGGFDLEVTVTAGGTNYRAGHKIKYLGTQLPGGATPDNDIILTVTAVDGSGTITSATAQGTMPASNVTGLTAGTNYQVASGLSLNVQVDTVTGSILASVNTGGSNYVVGDVAYISGTEYAGGATPTHDTEVTVVSVGGSGDVTSFATANIPPTNILRIRVNGVDFTASGGAWTMKQSLGSEAFVWTPSWNKAIGGSVNDQFNSVTYSNDGNSHIYAVGQGYYEVEYSQSLVVKFDATNGDILWSKFINSGTENAEATGVSSMPISTDIIVAGREYSTSLNNRWVGFVARMTATGTVVWKRLLGNTWFNDVNDGLDVTVDAKENIYVSTSYNDNHGWINRGHAVTKFNPDGNILWMRTVNSYGASSDLGSWNGTGWSSFDETTQQLVTVGYTNSFDDDYRCGLWVGFPADGYTYFGGEGEFTQQGPWRFGLGSLNVLSYETVTAQDFTPTPFANNIDTIANAKYYRTKEPIDKFPQWLTTMADEVNGGLVFGDGSKQTFATNITPQVRAYQDYQLRPTDSGKHIYYGPNTNSGTIAIPYWDNVKLPVGFTFTIVNRCGGDVYVQLAGGNQTGSIYGSGRNAWSTMWGIPDSGSGSVVTLIKVEEGFDSNGVYQGDVWMISGPDSIYTN